MCNTVLKRKGRGHALPGCILSPEADAHVELKGAVTAVLPLHLVHVAALIPAGVLCLRAGPSFSLEITERKGLD